MSQAPINVPRGPRLKSRLARFPALLGMVLYLMACSFPHSLYQKAEVQSRAVPFAGVPIVTADAAPPAIPVKLDRYGGIMELRSARGATGHWRVEKFGKRWLFVTPDGNAFFSIGVFDVTPTETADDLGGNQAHRVRTKYGDSDITWGPQQVRRLRSWGFNTVLDHSLSWVEPWQTCGGCRGWEAGQSERMPATWFQDGASYPIRNVFHLAPESAKDIIAGADPKYYDGYLAPNTDPFDPNFGAWLNAYFHQSESQQISASAYTIGFSSAESDFVYGFGAGASDDFASVPPGHNSPHLGWIVLVTSPTQDANRAWDVRYTDKTVYAKLALRDFLRQRYTSAEALNSAWSSHYTSFDSDGGWGRTNSRGSLPHWGLLDENGSSPWVPRDWENLREAGPALKHDLDDFLYLYALRWFQTQRDALKKNYPAMLYFGPNVVGSWWTPPRKEILRAAGQTVDVLMTELAGGVPDEQQRLDFTMRYLGDKPMACWIGITANPDSALWRHRNDNPLRASTQAERAQIYNRLMNWYLAASASSAVPDLAGTHPFVGVRWWAFADSVAERANWGLVTPEDNAYDGIEDTVAGSHTPGIIGSSACRDSWGYPCGSEERDYGDFLTAARNTNWNVLQFLAAEHSKAAVSASAK